MGQGITPKVAGLALQILGLYHALRLGGKRFRAPMRACGCSRAVCVCSTCVAQGRLVVTHKCAASGQHQGSLDLNSTPASSGRVAHLGCGRLRLRPPRSLLSPPPGQLTLRLSLLCSLHAGRSRTSADNDTSACMIVRQWPAHPPPQPAWQPSGSRDINRGSEAATSAFDLW